ncbi:MAG: nickel pincer cofactor biosynthesis protein LarB [Acidobacteria bacterium]|nr:nickel pincer cofactor biosynthesis protein LarB [Acidobacteriota bacterium]
MDRPALDALLEAVAGGEVAPAEAARRLARLPVVDLGYARIDTHRPLRTGLPEAIYARSKTPGQLREIARAMLGSSGGAVLATKAGPEHFEAVRDLAPEATFHEPAGLIVLRSAGGAPTGRVAVVTAGTSDLPVADEAAFAAEALGAKVERVADVGVAGVHRLLAVEDLLAGVDVVIVVAGMDGALPSAIAGLVGAPVVAVPTSVGYGASFGGLAALLTMLNSCAPGVAVANIDNGFGAAAIAARILGEPS